MTASAVVAVEVKLLKLKTSTAVRLEMTQRFLSHDITQSFHDHVLSTCHKNIAQTSSKSGEET